jgi:hypothetical protein
MYHLTEVDAHRYSDYQAERHSHLRVRLEPTHDSQGCAGQLSEKISVRNDNS